MPALPYGRAVRLISYLQIKIKSNIFSPFALIYYFIYDKLYIWGVAENGKRFAFRQSTF